MFINVKSAKMIPFCMNKNASIALTSAKTALSQEMRFVDVITDSMSLTENSSRNAETF